MTKKGFKSATLSEKVHAFLEKYQLRKGLKSISKAVETLITEAGYSLEEAEKNAED